MINRLKNQLLLTIDQFTPSDPQMEIVGIFNPGVAVMDDEIILLVRVAEAHLETTEDVFYSPKISNKNGDISYTFEKHQSPDYKEQLSVSQSNVNDKTRLPHISHFQIVRLDRDGYTVKSIETHPDLYGGILDCEEYGIEDARITQIENTYYITYVGVSSTMNVCTCLMSTKDFKHFERHGIIFACENKDVIIHPEKVDGMYMCYHRPVPSMQFLKPSIWTALSPDLLHWGQHKSFLPVNEHPQWDSYRNGAGTTAIKTPRGWLQLYHGVKIIQFDPAPVPRYTAGAVLADRDNPRQVIAKTQSCLLEPEQEFEKKGYIDNVLFPTGWVEDKDNPGNMIIYYGCADANIAAVTLSIEDILNTLPIRG